VGGSGKLDSGRHGECITSNEVVRLLFWRVALRWMMGGGQLWDEETDRSCVRG
jgi:hypothetical protein